MPILVLHDLRRRRGGRAEYVRPAPQKIEVAKGVYLFISKPYGDVGLDGNSVAILSNDGVLVFDSNGTPAASAAVLAEIRHAHRPAGAGTSSTRTGTGITGTAPRPTRARSRA